MFSRLLAAAAALALAACAAPAPAPGDSAAAPLEFDLQGALPAPGQAGEPLMASRVAIGTGDDLFSYDASYAVEPGTVFADTPAPPGVPAAQHLAAQHLASQLIGHDLRLHLPLPTGEPLALQVGAELREQWKSDGSSVARQRQAASLAWSPGPADLELRWHGGTVDKDAGLALGCELGGRLEIPLQPARAGLSSAISISGRDCQVTAEHGAHGELEAASWGVAMRWAGRDRETRLQASMIDPRRDAPSRQDIGASYELGMSHHREYGAWSARTLLAMRYAARHAAGTGLAEKVVGGGAAVAEVEHYWTAGVSLTRHLPAASLTAHWSHGADPAWFMPAIGARTHRLDMRLDFSHMMAALLPRGEPQLVMEWRWSQARSRSDEIVDQSAVRLDMGIGW